jgi:hypothetical protein
MKDLMNVNEVDPVELQDTAYNFKIIKNTNKEIKQMVQATSKIVCNIEKFHILIPIMEENAETA